MIRTHVVKAAAVAVFVSATLATAVAASTAPALGASHVAHRTTARVLADDAATAPAADPQPTVSPDSMGWQ